MITDQQKVTVGFTEEMKGYVAFSSERMDYQAGHDQGKKEGNFFMFHLTITVPDIDFFVNDPREQAGAVGWVKCKQLGGKLEVEKGVFNLFVDTGKPDEYVKNMRYRLFFKDKNGRKLTFHGHKVVKDDGVMNIWHDTTHLYSRIYEGYVEEGGDEQAPLVATGIIIILPRDFAKQLTTFNATGPTREARRDGLLKFGKIFMGTLWEVYAAQFFRSDPQIFEKREIPLLTLEGVQQAEITTHSVTTGDKIGISLMRFKRSESKDVVVLSHGLTTSTDMYIMPEQSNLVNYLHNNGYGDVISIDWRGSMRHSYNLFPNRFNVDDVALFDYPAALAKIREIVGPDKKLHFIVHCVGSISFFMALYGGAIAPDGIGSIISNSVSLNPRIRTWTKIKMWLFLPFLYYFFRFPNINPNWANLPGPARGKYFAKVVDLFHPECDVSECHMLSLMWGTGMPACYEHANLSEITHRRVGDLFGAVELSYWFHLRKMVWRGVVVKDRPRDPKYEALPNDYLDDFDKIDIPILFMTGTKNKIFPLSNKITYETLKKLKPDSKNELFLPEGYGHQDTLMGKNNYKDIFPRLIEFLNKHR